MEKKLLNIHSMSYSQSQSGAYTLILQEAEGRRRLPIVIGGFEAQSIALGIERLQSSRPMTHDLMKNFAIFFGIDIVEVIINKFKDGIFYALLICKQDNKLSEIDSRTSDAVALAIRFNCPIYTYDSILQEAGIVMEDEITIADTTETAETDEDDKFSQYLTKELEKMLQEAIDKEDFERASVLRDEIKKRKAKD
ncbi:MAG: bifunctional nuclease family protein [Bacteroidales bacterium]|jgi:bifunctional DNase/RNase|nr:bifunctional nuclease family protein [Bacteroidales bacterium]MDD3701879.1 bifunctional nuclease family protein [Bacteroidales bacterium]MDY0369643.1 bifunctional nuclease family protein [Bacteroidales bacterium]